MEFKLDFVPETLVNGMTVSENVQMVRVGEKFWFDLVFTLDGETVGIHVIADGAQLTNVTIENINLEPKDDPMAKYVVSIELDEDGIRTLLHQHELPVTEETTPPPPDPEPTYGTQTMYVQTAVLNKRSIPTTVDNNPVPPQFQNGDAVEVYDTVVDEAMLEAIGIQATIQGRYDWRYIPSLNLFVAEYDKIGRVRFLA